MKTQKLYTKLEQNRWHFGMLSLLRPGAISWSINSWQSEREAKKAGKREFGGRKIIWNPTATLDIP